MRTFFVILATISIIVFSMTTQAANIVAGKMAYTNCIACHGISGEGGIGPKLAGVDAIITTERLKQYRIGKHLGPMSTMMAPMAKNLSDEDIANIAAYTAGL